MKTVCLTAFAGSIALLSAQGQSYSIGWHKIAGGGGASTNSQFSLRGTIGQPDAGTTMTGGGLSLTGGFWSIYAVQSPGAPLLSISYAHNQAVISWPAGITGFTLQTNSDLARGTWGNYTGAIVNNSVTNTSIKGSVYFRLKN